MNRVLLLIFLCFPFVSSAVTVQIFVVSPPNCTYDNGELTASANGGVGPYTFLWSTGATGPSLTQVSAGSYSVTVTDALADEATAMINVVGDPYGEVAQSSSPHPLCAEGELLLVSEFDIYGPVPYTLDGMQMAEWYITGTYAALFGGPEGQTMVYEFADALGCTGTYTHTFGYAPEWPTVTVLELEGACANSNNGSVTVQLGLEGHSQFVYVNLWRADQVDPPFSNCCFSGGNEVKTFTFGNLEAGDWYLHMAPNVPSNWNTCYDTTLIHIPDLGTTCGNLSGKLYLDQNGDCMPQSVYDEPLVQAQVLEILPGPYYTIATNGNYSINLPNGSYTVEQQPTNYFDHCNTAPVPFEFTPTDGVETINFGDTSLVPFDAEITMASGAARPGFQVQYGINIANLSPQVTGANTVSMTYDPVLSFVSATPAPTTNTGNVLTWNTASLSAFQQRSFQVYLQVPPDITLLGTTLSGTATLTSTNTDGDLTNNSVSLPVTVTGAYDPNDKIALTNQSQSSTGYVIDEDEWLDYTIRFQNTGTDTAFNIVITDTISPVLDLGTFHAGASSHTYTVDIRDGNVLRFAFYNIQLPDSNVNEPRSHGFVSFRIVPELPILPGTELENVANIFFDFNPPVITDPSVLVAELSTEIVEHSNNDLFLVPNPTNGLLSVQVSELGFIGGMLNIRSIDGRLVRQLQMFSSRLDLDLTDLRSGAYWVEVVEPNGRVFGSKLLKY